MDPQPSEKVVQVLLNVIKKHWSFHSATGAYSPLKTPVFLFINLAVNCPRLFDVVWTRFFFSLNLP